MSQSLRAKHDQCIWLIKRKALSIYSSSYTSQTRFPDGRSHHTSKVHVCSIRFIFTIAHTHIIRSHEQKARRCFLIKLRIAHALPGRAQGQNAHMFAEQLAGRCTCSGWAGAEEGGRGAVETNCAGHLAERCKTQSTTPSCSNCVKSASKE